MSEQSNNAQNNNLLINDLPGYQEATQTQRQQQPQPVFVPIVQNQNQQSHFSQSLPPANAHHNMYFARPMPGQQYQYQAIPTPQSYRNQQKALSRSLRAQRFQEAYPVGYVIFHSVFMILLSLALITIQILSITNNGLVADVAGGIWSGCWMLFTIFFTLTSS